MALDCTPQEPRAARGASNARPALDARPRQHLEVHFGRHHLRDLVEQGSAYACPVHAHAGIAPVVAVHVQTAAFLVDAGKAVKPFVTPDDPAAFESALRERGVEVADRGTAPVV